MQRLLIKNGRVVDPSQGLDQGMDVLLQDGRVARIGEQLRVKTGTLTFDAAGLVVAPGFIDLSVHLREPGFEYKETIASGCRAAVAGGFTAVCCSADTRPVHDDPSVTQVIRERAEDVGLARVYPVGAVSRGLAGTELAEIGEMVRAGAVAVGDPGPVTSSQLMRRALEYTASFGVPVTAHAEDVSLSDGGLMHEGAWSTRIGLRAAPGAAEEVAVARDLVLVRLTGGRLHLRHLSTAGALALVRAAKAEGLAVTCDVTPHHLTLTDGDVAAATYDPNWKLSPPLRSAADVEAVHRALYDGTVDAIASDHAPHHRDEKELDFSEAPSGCVGLETAVSIAIDRLLHGKKVGLGQLIRLFSTGPAEAFRLPGGSLKPGSPADVTILDLRRRVTVDPATFRSKSRNTPFVGFKLRGAPVATIVGGEIVWQIDH